MLSPNPFNPALAYFASWLSDFSKKFACWPFTHPSWKNDTARHASEHTNWENISLHAPESEEPVSLTSMRHDCSDVIKFFISSSLLFIPLMQPHWKADVCCLNGSIVTNSFLYKKLFWPKHAVWSRPFMYLF